VPNLLVNGADGIAVGMATKIVPHNLGEIIDAAVHLIDHPGAQPMDLLEFVQGPDFPTGGIIYGRQGPMQAELTGRGRVIVRGKHEIETFGGDRDRIVFTEIPYQVNKADLLIRIAELAKDKVIEGISDLRDESDRQGMRMVIELKRDTITDVVLNQLWKHTPLQSSYGVQNLALVDGRPQTLGLRDLLRVFLDHRVVVVTRRTRFELDKAEKRAHILEGLLVALDRIDEVVALIRASKDADTARSGLVSKFALSDEQAKAILEMRLQKLTGLESDALRTEHKDLQERIAYYRKVLGDDTLVYGIIRGELVGIKDEFADARRTTIEDGEIDIDDESLIPEEESMYMHTAEGYLKRMPLATYREQNRGGKGLKGMKAKEEDQIMGTTVGSTHDWLCFFTNTGRVHWLKGYRVPAGGRHSRGKPVQNLITLEEAEKVETIIPVRDFEEDGAYLFFATRRGIVKRTPLSAYKNVTRVGIKAIELRDGDELLAVRKTHGDSDIILATRLGQAVRFDEVDVRPMGRVATGVRGATLNRGDEVVSLAEGEPGCEVLTVTVNGYGKRTPLDDYRKTSRGAKGVRTIIVNDRNGGVCSVRTVHGHESLLMVTANGMVVRAPVAQVSVQGRSTQGVTLIRTDDGDTVAQVAVLEPEGGEGREDGEDRQDAADAADGPGDGHGADHAAARGDPATDAA
jgi:DNA gyrase subunit A